MAVPLTSSLRGVFSSLRPHRSAFRRGLFAIKNISQTVDILPLTTNEVEDLALLYTLIREFFIVKKNVDAGNITRYILIIDI